MILRNSVVLDRERKEYDRLANQQAKVQKELSERKRRKPISIQIQILTGRKIQIYIDPEYDTLIDLKKKIQIKEGIHPDQQILFYNGIRLQDYVIISTTINTITNNSNNNNHHEQRHHSMLLKDILYISPTSDDVSEMNNDSICLFLTLRNRGG